MNLDPDIELKNIIQAVLNPQTRRKWDPFRSKIEVTQSGEISKQKYCFKFPILYRNFEEYFTSKEENNELTIINYSMDSQTCEKERNLFTCMKVIKKVEHSTLVYISQFDYIMIQTNKLPLLCSKIDYLTVTALANFLQH